MKYERSIWFSNIRCTTCRLVTDGAVLSTIVDGTILICSVGQANIEATQRSKKLLDKVNANI